MVVVADVASLLPRITQALRVRAPLLSPAKRRAAVAILLRDDAVRGCEVLYIRRATSRADPWSGHVAFPGGKRDEGDSSDKQTAVREVAEEIGLDLRDEGGPFSFLGQLDDRPIMSGGSVHADSSYSAFVFLQKQGTLTPPLALQATEVAACGWVPLAHLCASPPPHGGDVAFDAAAERGGGGGAWGVERPVSRILPPALCSLLPLRLLTACGLHTLRLPAIPLHTLHVPLPLQQQQQHISGAERHGGGASTESRGGARRSGSSLPPRGIGHAQHQLLHTLANGVQEDEPPLWGMTLQATSDLVQLGGHHPLNWPPIHFHRNRMCNALVLAACGGVEMWRAGTGAAPWAHVRWSHAAHFVGIVGVVTVGMAVLLV